LFLANTSCHSNVDRMCYFYHMNKLLSLLLIGFITTIISCKGKKTESVSNNSLIDVVSIIKAQIKHVDTSLFSIIKLEWADTTHTDTTYIKREDFEAVAKDFLQLPELSNPKIAKDYKQESRYDSLTRKVIISYFPKEDKNEIRKIELMASVDEIGKDGNNKVTNILDPLFKKCIGMRIGILVLFLFHNFPDSQKKQLLQRLSGTMTVFNDTRTISAYSTGHTHPAGYI
jgi:hypothetical protein